MGDRWGRVYTTDKVVLSHCSQGVVDRQKSRKRVSQLSATTSWSALGANYRDEAGSSSPAPRTTRFCAREGVRSIDAAPTRLSIILQVESLIPLIFEFAQKISPHQYLLPFSNCLSRCALIAKTIPKNRKRPNA
jgi:hypothetical protein